MARTVMIMAGGTGGHVFPALAVARELQARGVTVSWLGTRSGIEAELVPAAGIELDYIDVAGVRGKGWSARLKAPFQITRALAQALAVLRRRRPGAALGMGGFAAGPGGLAARLVGVPLVIHEQNAVPGTTNRLLAKIANRVLEAFPLTLRRGVPVGNPIRSEICRLPEPAVRGVGERGRPRLLVLGGSLGALAINKLVPEAVARLPEAERPEIRHQCGRKHVAVTEDSYRKSGVPAQVQAFVGDMAEAYGWADFVVCRAGALTVSELAAAGVGALLIPFPAAIDDHQTRNGEWLTKADAAVLIQQRNLDADVLADVLAEVLGDPARMAAMATRARSLAKPKAAAAVADVCEEVMA